MKLLPAILEIVKPLPVHSFFDGFSGSTRVSQMAAQEGYQVISNDISDWSRILATSYLKHDKPLGFYSELIEHLNAVSGYDGWFSEQYGGDDFGGSAVQSDGLKKPWQRHNTRKLDGIRDEIARLNLSEIDEAVALTSLMLALDSVDSTLGHFSSYLRKWSPRSYKKMILKTPHLFENNCDQTVLQDDIFNLGEVEADIAYFDPPYGSNNEKMPPSRVRYASYYHLWTSIIKNDKPELFGKVGRRVDTRDSVAISPFEEFRRGEDGRFLAVAAIDRLIAQTHARFILLSYSSGGRATISELSEVLTSYGNVKKVVKIDHKKNVMAEMKWSKKWLADNEQPFNEFLFLLER
ncbi:DNA adenine methylase [bacterium]|nr:DNA adenine methylase [bacterium]